MIKKIIAVSIIAIAVIGLLIGCTRKDQSAASSASTAAPRRLVVWMAPDETRFMMDSGLPEKFMRENPQYTLEVVPYPWDTLHDKLMASFTGGEIPAVSQSADHWVGEFAPLGGLLPFDNFRSKYGHTDNKFLPNMWDHFRFTDGKIYGAPFIAESRIMFYRKDLLEAAGFSAAPKTWDEVFEYGKKLSNGNNRFTLSHQDQWLDFHFFSSILYAIGGDYFNAQATECVLNNPAGIEALTLYKRLYDENVIPKDPQKRVDAFAGFKEGYYAMAHSGAWWFGLLNSQAPELEGKWGVAMLPEAKTTTVYGHPNPWVIPVNNQYKNGFDLEGAEAWINFMYDNENAIQFTLIYGGPPPIKSVYDDPRIKSNTSIMALVEAIDRGTNSIHNVPNAETISEVVWNGLSDIRDGVKTPKQAADTVVASVNSYLK